MKPVKPLHSIKTECKVLHYKEDGFYLIRLYDYESGEVLHTDSYFIPNDGYDDIMMEARDFRERVNKYPSPFHVHGEIEYIERQ